MEEQLNIWLTGYENFCKCFELTNNLFSGFEGWKIVDNKMVLYWHYDKEWSDVSPFPCRFNSKQIADFVWPWLSNADYGEEPDTDGSTRKGFHFEARTWWPESKFGSDHHRDYAFVVITPIWFVYGK